MVVVGLVLLGGLGVWRLADVFPSNRERVVALVTYVAMPLLPGVMSTGRLSALVAYAAVPWFVNALRLVVGIGTADPRTVDSDLADGVLDLGRRERVRRTAVAALVAAVAGAMAPPVLLILAAVAVVLGVTSLLAGAPWRTGAWFAGAGARRLCRGVAAQPAGGRRVVVGRAHRHPARRSLRAWPDRRARHGHR